MTAPLLLLALTLGHADPDTTVRLPRNGAIEIETRMRDVTVRTGPSDIVTIRGGTAELDGGTLQIGGDDRRSRGGGSVDVTIPTWARVDVSSVSGNLTFIGAPDRLHAETVNGFIRVSGGGGSIELTSVAGSVAISDFHGTRLSVDATGGPVTVTNAGGTIVIDNVNGNVTLQGVRSSHIEASTINGAVEFEGPFAATGRYEFSSQNGNVTLVVPGDVSARMKISTMNGQLISPQIPATTNGARDPSPDHSGVKAKGKRTDHGDDGEYTFTVTYGGGAAQVTVDVFNGNVIVKKKA